MGGRGSNYRSLKAGSMSGPISVDTSRLLANELWDPNIVFYIL